MTPHVDGCPYLLEVESSKGAEDHVGGKQSRGLIGGPLPCQRPEADSRSKHKSLGSSFEALHRSRSEKMTVNLEISGIAHQWSTDGSFCSPIAQRFGAPSSGSSLEKM